ncbi:hypothetical protein BGZ96_009546 [Linnemannia gamsii]|uniref:Uncharacterized protein n=1 Tax=Linnemannia gamsii TaxID=64522 RepID=A0ABQ7JWV7_9FUNG|nr:hypothetical protein BGZ96_009546 [Linnemannia gamsii]
MTMNPRKSVPRPPAEFRIRSTTNTATPLTCNTNINSTATYSNTSSHLDKALPAPPKRALFKGLKTRLRSHSFSSSTFSFPTSPQDHSVIPLVSSGTRSSSTVSTTPESVAQEYARTIKSLWKMVEDEEQAYRLVEASHSLSGSIPTITDIVPGGRLVNRPPYIDTMTAALRRPSLPLSMAVTPIQEEDEEETSSMTSTTSETRTPFSPRPASGPRRNHHHHDGVSFIALDNIPFRTTKPTTDNATALVVSTLNEMDDTVADLEVSLVGLSDASEEEDYAEDSEEEEERAVVHVAQKISVYRGRSFCWSQPS